jgi:SAM-dependent methyltransferase
MHPQERRDLPLKAAERHQLRKRSFDAAARLYDKFRPGYPEPLFNDLVELSGLPEGGRILEIGPGTGQATLPLARRGFSIVGIEMGASMARLCRRNLRGFPNVEILNVAFEDWTGDTSSRKTGTVPSRGPVRRGQTRGEFDAAAPGACPLGGTVPCFPRSFDMVFAATAFHWVASKSAFTRCAKVLKPHGSLALVWNFADIPDKTGTVRGKQGLSCAEFDASAGDTSAMRSSRRSVDVSPPQDCPSFSDLPGAVPALSDMGFYDELRAIYRRIVPHMHHSAPPELRIERQRKKIVSSGLFGPVTVRRYPWQSEYTADRYIGLLRTMSDHAILAPQVRRDIFRAIRKLIDDNGGTFIRPVVAVLFLAPKRGGRRP